MTADDLFPKPRRAWSLVGVLIVCYAVSYLDRQILSLLVEPIKHDLSLNDTEISILQGFSLTVFLAIFGILLGRWVDTGRRLLIIAAGMTLWSLMTIGCGLASNYWMLIVCRIGVGIGEAALIPAAYSLIGDCFPPKRLSIAMAVYGVGSYLGIGSSYFIGAAILSHLSMSSVAIEGVGVVHPWQIAFVIAGLPGLALAMLLANLREPSRQGPAASSTTREVVAYFRANLQSVALLDVAIACAAMMTFSSIAWAPSFMIRRFGLTAGQAGAALGLVIAASGTLGLFAGGLAGDFMLRRGIPQGRLIMMIAFCVCAAPFAVFAALAGSPTASMVLLTPALLLTTAATMSGAVAQQEMVPNQMRGVATSVGGLAVNLLGSGAGPTIISLVTDYVVKDERKIGYALASAPPIMLLAAAAAALACLRPYQRTLEALADWRSPSSRNRQESREAKPISEH